MSDRIAVINKGRIEQLGDARRRSITARKTTFVANFIGQASILARPSSRGAATRAGPARRRGLELLVNAEHLGGPGGHPVSIRPEKIALRKEPQGAAGEPLRGARRGRAVQGRHRPAAPPDRRRPRAHGGGRQRELRPGGAARRRPGVLPPPPRRHRDRPRGVILADRPSRRVAPRRREPPFSSRTRPRGSWPRTRRTLEGMLLANPPRMPRRSLAVALSSSVLLSLSGDAPRRGGVAARRRTGVGRAARRRRGRPERTTLWTSLRFQGASGPVALVVPSPLAALDTARTRG